MLQADDSALPLPRHRQACTAVSRRPRAPAPPPGLTDPSRTAGLAPKISTFCSKVNSTFCMRACAWPPPPNNSASPPRPNQLATLLNYRCSKPRRPATPPPRHPATGLAAPAFSCACARGNELTQHSRLAATLISEPPPSCNAALPPRRNASCCRPRACAGGPRG